MHSSLPLVALVNLACLVGLTTRAAGTESSGKDLGQLYDRIAADVHAGRPLVATIYVALCDNDAQGIVKVRNRRICRGDDPEQNLYWATAGGLSATLKAAGWKRLSVEWFADGDLAVKSLWRKSLTPGGALRARGIRRPIEVFVVGLGYRGVRIREAMVDYLEAVNEDRVTLEVADGRQIRSGGESHVVAYIGHDYFYDISDWAPLLSLNRGDSTLQKGTLALSCTGHRLIRPAIRRGNVHIFLLNRTLGFPGAWAAEAAITALAGGADGKAIHRAAAEAFAAGMKTSVGTAMGAFAYGD
jgi:hypothetical protein